MNRIIPSMAIALALAVPLFLHDATPASAASSSDDEIGDVDLSIVPMPPSMDSIQFMLDQARYKEGLAERIGPRGAVAAADADFKAQPSRFSEALGLDITKEKTPALHDLIKYVSKTTKDKGVRPAKHRTMRLRPYVLYETGTCYPADEANHRNSSAYPSGHTAQGWAVAQALCEAAPDRTSQIMRRGWEIGQSRVICGYHWQSDVDAGRILADLVMVKLRTTKKYQNKVRKAREEYAKLTSKKSAK